MSETPDFSYLGVETFHGKLVINWPMPTAVTDLLSEDYYIESSCNSFTALACSAQEFPSQKDTLRPKRYLKPRDIKIVFYIPVTTMTTSSVFKRQWEFITTAVVGLTRRLELGDDVPPPHGITLSLSLRDLQDGMEFTLRSRLFSQSWVYCTRQTTWLVKWMVSYWIRLIIKIIAKSLAK